MIAQIYVDVIVFGSTSDVMKNEFVSTMQKKFETSILDELTYFNFLACKGAFLSQTKYAYNLGKLFGLDSAKVLNTNGTIK